MSATTPNDVAKLLDELKAPQLASKELRKALGNALKRLDEDQRKAILVESAEERPRLLFEAGAEAFRADPEPLRALMEACGLLKQAAGSKNKHLKLLAHEVEDIARRYAAERATSTAR